MPPADVSSPTPETKRGTIRHVFSHGGMLKLTIELPATKGHKHGENVIVFADNAPAIRAFDEAFGNVIVPQTHSFDPDALIGREIEWDVDDVGVMLWMNPL